MRLNEITPEFVELIPKELQDGVIYISEKYKTASHKCCCGCGTKIVTSLRETGWKLTINGGRVSLWPSIGNWNHPCNSHYFISNNLIEWSYQMTPEQIERGRARDDAARAAYYSKTKESDLSVGSETPQQSKSEFFRKIFDIFAWIRKFLKI